MNSNGRNAQVEIDSEKERRKAGTRRQIKMEDVGRRSIRIGRSTMNDRVTLARLSTPTPPAFTSAPKFVAVIYNVGTGFRALFYNSSGA
jgi:hypothetical protein